MKSKCSFILKASLSLVLALLMLFGTVATSLAAAVDNADTGAASEDLADTGAQAEITDEGAKADLAEAGAQYNHNWGGTVYFRVPDTWDLDTYDGVRCVIRRTEAGSEVSFNTATAMTVVGNASYSRLYKCTLDVNHSSWGQNEYIGFFACESSYGYTGDSGDPGYNMTNTGIGHYTPAIDYGTNSGGYYLFYPNTIASATTIVTNNPISGYYNATEADVMKYNTGSHSAYAYTNGSSSSTGGTTSIKSYYLSGTTPTESTNTSTPTATYSSAMTGAKTTFTANPKTNYEFKGWYSDSTLSTLISNNATYTFYTYSNETAANANKKLYAKFVTKPSVTVSASPAGGGTVKIAGNTVADSSSAYVSSDTDTAVTVTAASGYTISDVSGAGWERTEGETSTTSYTGTINVNANATLTVTYSEITAGIKLESYTNGALSTDGTGGHIEDGSGNTITELSGIGVGTKGTALSVVQNENYNFIGWTVEGDNKSHIKLYTNEGCTTEYAAGDATQTTIYVKTDGTDGMTTANAIVQAHFQSSAAHHITVYNTTKFSDGNWYMLSTPPQKIVITNPAGVKTTYTYKAGDMQDRGEDDEPYQRLENNVTSGFISHAKNTSGDYYEGNPLEIHAGDKIEMTYSALASSDIISGVFYDNKVRFTTQLEPDNLYSGRVWDGAHKDASNNWVGDGEDDGDENSVYSYVGDRSYSDEWEDGYTLYANAGYYSEPTKTTINNQSYAATVDQNTHTITWTAADHDYLNIDLELASKKMIHFSDTANAVINHINTDDYYAIGEDISPGTAADTSLSIKAAGNASQTNTITKANIKLYYCNNMGEFIDPTTGRRSKTPYEIPSGSADDTITVNGESVSIANVGAADSTGFYYLDGTMPATDVYVDLELVVTFTVKMYSKILSDTNGTPKHDFYQVADLTLGETTYNKKPAAATGELVATDTCESGKNITMKAANPDSGYMFVGWYLGTDSEPDYSKPISTSDTFSYKPTASVTVWAVGTRDLYIVGDIELFPGDTTDYYTHHQMKFDPSLGTGGVYYYEISEIAFAAASRQFSHSGFYNGGDGYKYWDNNNYTGNSQFQFRDLPTDNDDTRTVWSNLESFYDDNTDVAFGKVYFPTGTYDQKQYDGIGVISFTESAKDGYSTPITIYYDPNGSDNKDKKLYVKSTPVYPRIHVSSGYKDIDTSSPSHVKIQVNDGTAYYNDDAAGDKADGYMNIHGSGWNPNEEGHVSDIEVKARNAKLTLTKTTANANYKVSNFVVYNMTANTVKAYPAVATANDNEYQCDKIYTHDNDRLYIVPIVEYCGSSEKITVIVNSTDLDYSKWGRLVGCYAYGSIHNNGDYPGQLMVPSDDGKSWKATFEATGITAIMFTNYVSDAANATFLNMSGVLGSVSTTGSGTDGSPYVKTATGGYVNTYNSITGTDKGLYDQINFKAQTYDYREPIAYFNNKKTTDITLTFAIKTGNSNLISWKHSELISHNILTMEPDPDWDKLEWEYLTDSSGNKYADLNGYALPEKPAASFYIAAKAMVIYDDNTMQRVFGSGKYGDATTEVVSSSGFDYKDYKGYTTDNLDMNFAVQWYIYDASGQYITNVLSAGFADKSSKNNAMSVVTQRLLDLGYAVEGRSVKISYDKARYCYDNHDSKPNSGNNFDVYRFTGQWYQDDATRLAKVYAKVGIMTDSGEDVADASTAAYGSASVSIDRSKASLSALCGTDYEDDVDFGYSAVTDGDKGVITLKASASNFKGWYHYDTDNKLQLDTTSREFTPSYMNDSTYIAMYEAKVNYSYTYAAREGGTKAYSVSSNTKLTADEIAAGNKVDGTLHIDDATASSPGSAGISSFKKDVEFNPILDTSMFSNLTEYVLTVANSSVSTASYRITAKYRNESGGLNDLETGSIQYNSVVDLKDIYEVRGGTGNLVKQWPGHTFIGWYEYDNNTYGKLLSTQANYGMVMVKDQTIIAVYTDDGSGKTGPTGGDAWEVFIDDFGDTYEKTSATAGTVYTDAIVRVRKNRNNVTTLDENARVGYLIVDDNGTNQTIDTDKLAAYANALSKSSGMKGNITVTVGDNKSSLSVTNLFTTTVNNFGRADIAAKNSFATVAGHKYYIYAYYYDGTGAAGYHFDTTNAYATKTYNSLP